VGRNRADMALDRHRPSCERRPRGPAIRVFMSPCSRAGPVSPPQRSPETDRAVENANVKDSVENGHLDFLSSPADACEFSTPGRGF
jgi:hypothetical protein